MKKILVIVAHLNGGDFLKQQIATILYQVDVEVTIMIFDDLSDDFSISTLMKDPRIIIINNKVRSGSPANNFFNALKHINIDFLDDFDYISFADADDYWLPLKLTSAASLLSKDNASVYFSNMIILNEELNQFSILKKNYAQKKYDFLFEGAGAGCTCLITSEFAINLRNYLFTFDYTNWPKQKNNRPYFSHDWFIYFYARLNKYNVTIDNNAYIIYRIHKNNDYGKINLTNFSAFKMRIELIANGWYTIQLTNFKKLLNINSIEYKICDFYTKNIFYRIYILLKYNFELMRSRNKFLKLLILSFIPTNTKNNVF